MHKHILSTATGSHSLPNELVDMVIKNLGGHSQALASLQRTCSAFRKLLRDGSLLYRKITVGKDPKSNDMMWLIRMLMEHPEYAAKIEELSITSHVLAPKVVHRSPRADERFTRAVRRRFDMDPTGGFSNNHLQDNTFLKSIIDRIKSAGDADQDLWFMFYSNRWITAILNSEHAAFAPILLGLCSSIQALTFDFDSNFENEIYTIPWLFQFQYVENARESYDSNAYQDAEEHFPGLAVDMPQVTLLHIDTFNVELVCFRFANLTTLEVNGCLFDKGHCGGSAVVKGESQGIPMLQKIIFRLDWSELSSSSVMEKFFLSIELPRVSSVISVLERSPREAQNPYGPANYAGRFDSLIEQINTECNFDHHPPVLQGIQEVTHSYQ